LFGSNKYKTYLLSLSPLKQLSIFTISKAESQKPKARSKILSKFTKKTTTSKKTAYKSNPFG